MNDEKSFHAPSKLLRALRKWLSRTFSHKFQYRGNTMARGTQHDWHSCGIILPNTIAHAIKAIPLWHQSQYVPERIQWFLRLASTTERQMPQSVPATNKDLECLLELNNETSVMLMIGDHNFPDLQDYALASQHDDEEVYTTERIPMTPPPRLSLHDLLNSSSDLDDGDVSNYEETTSDGMSAFNVDYTVGQIETIEEASASKPQTETDDSPVGSAMDMDVNVNDDTGGGDEKKAL